MAELRDKGIYEAVLFPYGGDRMKPAYFTEAWFDIVEHVLLEAKRTGMRIWLFNDSNFPSGKAGGTDRQRRHRRRHDRLTPQPRDAAEGAAALDPGRRQARRPIDPNESSGLSIADGRLVVDADIREGAHPLHGRGRLDRLHRHRQGAA